MVLGIDLNLLESLSNGDNLEKVQDIFNSLMLNIEEKLGRKPDETEIPAFFKREMPFPLTAGFGSWLAISTRAIFS